MAKTNEAKEILILVMRQLSGIFYSDLSKAEKNILNICRTYGMDWSVVDDVIVVAKGGKK